MELLIVFFFGFPGAFLSLVVSIIGVLKDKYKLALLGALLFLPFTYYLNGAPGSRGFVLLLPLLQFGSALAVFQKKRTLASLLLTPSVLTVLWVLGVVLAYSFGMN